MGSPANISPTKVEHTCERCGAGFYPKRTDRLRFCGRACSMVATGEQATARAALLWQSRGGWPVTPMVNDPCAVCGLAFERRASIGALYCSARCSARAHGQRKTAHKRRAFACVECGASFEPGYGDKRRAYCSPACSRKAGRRADHATRRARIKGNGYERVIPLRVFERDAWRCGLCRRMTLPAKRGTTHPRAPELDHIVPLSAGGAHSYRNTQCACRSCNWGKGAALIGQPRLFG